MAKGYTDKNTIEKYGTITIDTSHDAFVAEVITGVEETIDLITGRNFVANAVAGPRFYDGNGEKKLVIDDCVEVSSVEVGVDNFGGSFRTIPATGSNRFFLNPANHSALGVPVTAITLASDFFTRGQQNVRITGRWGYSNTVPAAIRRAATIFAFGVICNEQSSIGRDVKSEKIGNYTVSYDSDNKRGSWADFENAIASLDSYKRYYL